MTINDPLSLDILETFESSAHVARHSKIQVTKGMTETHTWTAWTPDHPPHTWRIIPVSKWLGSPLFTSHLGHLQGE